MFSAGPGQCHSPAAQRSRQHFSRLVRLILESQLPATLLSIAFLIQIRVAPTSLLASTFQSIQSKLYLISLLYSLNGRVTYWAGDVHGDTSDEKVSRVEVGITR